MRVAALYDIHGNLPALEAVLAECTAIGVEHVVVGGDVLPGPMPVESLDLLASLPIPVRYVLGNGDRESVGAREGRVSAGVPSAIRPTLGWVARKLRDDHHAAIRRWPATVQLHIDGCGDVLFCHATARSDTELFTRATPVPRIEAMFAGVEAAVVVCGHTHMQFDLPVDGMRIVNAGSVGMPFGETGADWLLLGPSGVELRHTNYDLVAAAGRIRATSYPQAAEFADGNVLTVPDAARMVAALSGA